MKKRVLLVINSPLINAGVPNVVLEIVRHLKDSFDFDILQYSTDEGVYDKEFLSYGGTIYKVDLLNYDMHKILYPYRYFQLKKALKKILAKEKYDVIHCHNGIESGICVEMARKFNIQVRISHAHGNYVRCGKNKILLKYQSMCKRMIFNYSTLNIACSSESGKSLFGENFINFLNPIDTNLYRDIRKQKHDCIELLQIGYFCSNKNQLHSVEVLKQLHNLGIYANLNLIGFEQENGYLDKIQQLVKDSKLDKYVHILPPNTNKLEIFPKIDCVLLPSHSEGLPLVALESQVAGIPCIMSDSISKDADIGNAFFIRLFDYDQWLNKIIYICSMESKISKVDSDLVDVNNYMSKIRKVYNKME